MPLMFHRMVIAGVGLIGGSLALAARKCKLVEEIIGFGRKEKNLHLAQRRGIIDRYFVNEDDIPRGTDLLILATPVQATVPLAMSLLPRLEPGCLISDVGSVKGEIVQELERLLPAQISFVGAHPIAGSEQWGAKAAIPDLFFRCRCILTPTRKTDPRSVKKLGSFWRRLGARVSISSASAASSLTVFRYNSGSRASRVSSTREERTRRNSSRALSSAFANPIRTSLTSARLSAMVSRRRSSVKGRSLARNPSRGIPWVSMEKIGARSPPNSPFSRSAKKSSSSFW
ncbi:MAG: prephenate dehydrogenase/arogenate dehydrogenase family protein [Deltaproteobacteria bacterium]|nr:prephenate dehydrogenase/arogenate dehydrogenase family protein [Deltaproteobacteria bacterium]